MMFLSGEESHKIIKRALAMSKADEAFVSLITDESTYLRFARNAPLHIGNSQNGMLSVRSAFGTQSGSASINHFDAASIERVIKRSEEVARLSKADPEFMSALPAQEYPAVPANFKNIRDEDAKLMAEGAAQCIRRAKVKNLTTAGYIEEHCQSHAIGNSNGLFGFHEETSVNYSQTVRTLKGDGSGWSCAVGNRMEEIPFGDCADVAVEKAILSQHPRPLKPGRYQVILEPSCVASLVSILAFSMYARDADEGRSFFSVKGGKNRVGEKLFSEKVNLFSDPTDKLCPATPWGADGIPQSRREWVKDGELKNLYYSRYWAKQQKKPMIPMPSNLIMRGSQKSLAEIISEADRAILITSLWYIRMVDPRTLLLTGLTRDGVFWIEKGKIAHPLQNFRWNNSPVAVLKNIASMTKTERSQSRDGGMEAIAVPALHVRDFEVTSLSEAI